MVIAGAVTPNPVVSLARYAELIGYSDCAFFGVARDTNVNYACREIWTKYERDNAALYLQEAQEEIEQEIGYPLSQRWFVEEKIKFRIPALTQLGWVVEGGVEAEQIIQANAPVSHLTDPATVTIATALTSTEGIKIFYPGTDMEIIPSSLSIAGGNLNIAIPRCRLVDYLLIDNPQAGLDYNTIANFETLVDVKRIYNDPSDQATLIWPHTCSTSCSLNNCSEYTDTACIYVKDPKAGVLEIIRARYSSGSWVNSSGNGCYGRPTSVTLKYRAGISRISFKMEMSIVRLAHSKMPDEPCGCDVVQRLWRRDRNTPNILTAERLNCPFGLSDGAWQAWKFIDSFRLDRVSYI